MKLKLHDNSLTIPSKELPGFLGSHILAAECRSEVRPAVDRHKCVLYARLDVIRWFDGKFGGKVRQPEGSK